MLRPRKFASVEGVSSTSGQKLSKSKRAKILLTLSILVGCALLINVDYSYSRQLKCRIARFGVDDVRYLEEGAVEDPCTVFYPKDAPDEIAYSSQTSEANYEPAFLVAADVNNDAAPQDSVSGAYIIEPPTSTSTSEVEGTVRGLLTLFAPKERTAEDAIARESSKDEGSIGYFTCLTGCQVPGWYDVDTDTPDAGAELLEDSSLQKCQVCETTDTAFVRHLQQTVKQTGRSRRLQSALLNYTMHAIIHPIANECPIQGNYGDTYDRAKLFQSVGYNVEILGQPIKEIDMIETNPYIAENINAENNPGIRNTMKLHIWRQIKHPIAVLTTFTSLMQYALTDKFDDLLNNDDLKGYYILHPDGTVDTDLLIVKPSLEEFDALVYAYIHTPYGPHTGWGNNGITDMSLGGFLAYYFASDAGYVQLDRCKYANNLDSECMAQYPTTDDIVAFKGYEKTCGNPKNCPYDDPSHDTATFLACRKVHQMYFNYRYTFEETKLANKAHVQERIGLFKPSTFLGYCQKAGADGYLSMTGDIIERPSWQVVCPPMTCPEGTFMKSDCTCTSVTDDPCDACPSGTRCQVTPTLMCIDCSCSFCDDSNVSCCSSNGSGSCAMGAGNADYCSSQGLNFPGIVGSSSICSTVDLLALTAVPNGCGCRPQSTTPCVYNPDWASEDDTKCFICTTADLALGACPTCQSCISSCANGECMLTANTVEEFAACLGSIEDDECSSNCHHQCLKSF